MSATDLGNFFNLRADPDAQPEFQELAYQILNSYADNKPKELKTGEWHLPFGDKYADKLTIEQMVKICTARCARVSYLNFEGNIDHEKDYKLHDDLIKSQHMSPLEHTAKALEGNDRVGNFSGYIQYRKMLQNENRAEFDINELLSKRRSKN